MKNLICVIICVTPFFSGFSQLNKTVIDDKKELKVLIGDCDREGFQIEDFYDWFKSEYDSYEFDKKIIKKLKKSDEFNKVTIKIVFGTWCHDSQREMPRFYKIIDKINFPESQLQLIGVDTKKESHDDLLKNIKFTKIPTFIIYKNKKEIGRIVESTIVNLETDLLNIIDN